jgi:hypothetical protein
MSAMNQLQVIGVVPSPIVRLDSVAIHSGYIALERNTQFRGIVRPTDLADCAFFVPDSQPYAPGQDPGTMALETSLRSILTLGNPSVVCFGAHNAQVTLASDPRGSENRWLQISFQTPTASLQRTEINYRLTLLA